MNMIINFDVQSHCSWLEHQDLRRTNVEKFANFTIMKPSGHLLAQS